MTRGDWKSWDEEQQLIAVATHCGWRRLTDKSGEERWYNKNDPNSINHYFSELPDYINDLNAMHEAEKFLDDTGKDRMARYIGRHDTWDILHATAELRAEAFCMAMRSG